MRFNKFLFFVLLLASISFVACDSSDDGVDDTAEEEVAALTAETQLNVSYGESDEQVYDLYLPLGRLTTKTKVVILVHGGGWIGGDKTDMNDFLQLVQNNHPDHAIVNMNYQLASATQTAFPDQFLDVQLVIDHLIENAANYQINTEFGLIGASAGAHISMMYDYVYDTDNLVKFVGNIVGPSDFTDPFYTGNPNFSILFSLLVDTSAYPPGIDLAVATSPTLQVSRSSSPTLLFYGDQDPLVPLTNGQTLDAALTTEDITHIFNVYEGGHGDDWSEEDLLNTQVQLSSYIDTYLTITE